MILADISIKARSAIKVGKCDIVWYVYFVSTSFRFMLVYCTQRTIGSPYMTFILKKSCGALHKTELFVQKVSILFNISLYLSPNWFGIRGQRTKIKRESGVNPGQSRCCETLYSILSISQFRTTDRKKQTLSGRSR